MCKPQKLRTLGDAKRFPSAALRQIGAGRRWSRHDLRTLTDAAEMGR